MNKPPSPRLAVYGTAAVAVGYTWIALCSAAEPVRVEGADIRVEFDNRMQSRVIARFDSKETILGPFTPSETVTVDGVEIQDFALNRSKHRKTVDDRFGAGKQTTVTGTASTIEQTVVITVYNRFPQMAFFQVQYTNKGTADVRVTGWSSNRYSIAAREGDPAPSFWSYESGSYERRPDWVVPLKVKKTISV